MNTPRYRRRRLNGWPLVAVAWIVLAIASKSGKYVSAWTFQSPPSRGLYGIRSATTKTSSRPPFRNYQLLPSTLSIRRFCSPIYFHPLCAASNQERQSSICHGRTFGSDAGRAVGHFLNHMPPPLQFCTMAAIYMFHSIVLTQRHVVFPWQIFPNNRGLFVSIAWDSLAGIATLLAYLLLYRRKHRIAPSHSNYTNVEPLPALFTTPSVTEQPWRLPVQNIRQRLSSLVTGMVLVQAYFWTGRWALFWQDMLYTLSGLGFGVTVPMHRALCVLLGHLNWVVLGTLLLRWGPRPPPFFGPCNTRSEWHNADETSNNDDSTVTILSHDNNGRSTWRWFRSTRRSNWVWWTLGGYFVSSWLFNMADTLNQLLLPASVLADAPESVVTQLVNPEHLDWAASIVGYVAPCVSAPWWEEVLYRGFVLAGLTQMLGYFWAVLIQGIVFSAHHMSLTAALPLAVLGWTWAILYVKSRNLLVVIMVHAMWNSRVFIGSWLGL